MALPYRAIPQVFRLRVFRLDQLPHDSIENAQVGDVLR
jgi:hypothetical protein